jgi:hypothetical protein
MLKYAISPFIFLLFGSILQAQCISGNCKNGKGTFMYPSGAKYVGEFINGEINGVGVCYYSDGSKYSGEWKNRYPDGRGTKTYSDQTKRTGLWRKGKPVDDKGNVLEEYIAKKKEEQNNDGTDIQSGCLSGDCQNGPGVFAYPDGSKYDGSFSNGKFNGTGIFTFANGDHYAGQFKDNFPHGRGVRTHANGQPAEDGEWREGEFVGLALIENGKTGCIEGDCQNGKGTYIYREGVAKYTGDFKDGQPHGVGHCLYANGDQYTGEWADGAFQGKGTLTLQSGTQVIGFWNEGEYAGKDTPPVDANNSEEPQPETKPANKPTVVAPDIKVWAVVVGVASYDHMPVLRYTDDDAYRFYAFLKSPEGGALPDDQVRILVDEEATMDGVTTTLTELFGQAGPNDLIVFYFSGHGLNGSFLPIDFDGYNNKLTHESIAQIFNGSKAKFKVCIADACHSGSLISMRSAEPEPVINQYYQTLAKSVAGTALIMSSKSDETSLESAGLRQGVFSHFLIRGLKGEADKNNDRIISVKELYDFVFKNVRDYTGNRQSPVIKGTYDPGMPISVIRQL